MEYKATIEYPKLRLFEYSRMFSYGKDDLIKQNVPKLTNIKTWTALFPHGYEADIKLNASEDDVWSEAILFNEKGQQLCCTEVCDSLEGEWKFEFDGDTYIVELKGI